MPVVDYKPCPTCGQKSVGVVVRFEGDEPKRRSHATPQGDVCKGPREVND